jgi:anti-sigma factor RsiW
MHPTEERIQCYLDGELSAADEASVRDHIAACAECRAMVESEKRAASQVYALLRALDHPPPQVDVEGVAARARVRTQDWGGALRRAAMVLAVIGIVGAAYALPGSPLRAWVKAAVGWIEQNEREGGADSRRPAPRAEQPETRASGIALAPGPSLVIEFTLVPNECRANVRLTEGAQLVVRDRSGSATFSSESDRLLVEARGSASAFEIEIPRDAPRVEIRAQGSRIFLKEGAWISTQAAANAGVPTSSL